jgi:REP element-mobilizing transposase RayT
MPVYLFTFHAYRSWSPAHCRGYVRRGEGILPSDPRMADIYDRQATDPPVLFTPEIQRILIQTAHEVCSSRQWRLHAAGTEPTHIHLLVSWKTFIPWNNVTMRLKNVMSLFLGRRLKMPKRKWFVRGESRKRVTDRKHFDHLMNVYLAKHRGTFWREGEELPQ